LRESDEFQRGTRAADQDRHQRHSHASREGMNDLASVCIGDYYTPQPKQQ
jgi:hypothetical protein